MENIGFYSLHMKVIPFFNLRNGISLVDMLLIILVLLPLAYLFMKLNKRISGFSNLNKKLKVA